MMISKRNHARNAMNRTKPSPATGRSGKGHVKTRARHRKRY